MKILTFIFTIFLIFPAKAELYKFEKYQLNNGLQIILAPSDGANVISQVIFYKAGRMDEYAGKSGVAHFLEHLMFRGDNKNFSSIIEKMGGQTNAYTSQDVTAYYTMVSSENMEKILKMESDRMKNLSFSDEEFLAEKSVVKQEQVMRYAGSPRTQFIQKINKIRWDNHPYATPVIGNVEEFADITDTDIKDFYNKFYKPNNAVLVLSGNFDINIAKELVEKYYGNHTFGEITRKNTKLPNFNKIKIVEKNNIIQEDMLGIFYNTKAFEKNNNKEAYALMIIAEILGGKGYNSKLYQELVIDEKIATNVSVSYDGMVRENGTFAIIVSFSNAKDAEEIEEIIFNELEYIAENGINNDELEIIKKVFLAEFIYEKEDFFSTADLLGQSTIIDFDINLLEKDLNALTSEDIKNIVQKVLSERNEIIAHLTKGEVDK